MRTRIAAGAAITMAGLAGTFALTTGAASADPSLNSPPQFYSGNNSAIVRTAGSDTTFYMMQSIADLYNQAALYGCTVSGAADFPCPSTGGAGHDAATTDDADNWARTEVLNGIDDVGSGDGQKQLCGVEASPNPVDVARSSKTNGGYCSEESAVGYAYDGVPEVDFQTLSPGAGGSPVQQFYASGPDAGQTTPWWNGVDTAQNVATNGGAVMGPVAAGWEPSTAAGNNVVTNPSTYTGVPFTNITNNDHGGGASSVAYRLYCETGGTQITDWGQLTNLAIPGDTYTDGTITGGGTDLHSSAGDFSAADVGLVVTSSSLTYATTDSDTPPRWSSGQTIGNPDSANPVIITGYTSANDVTVSTQLTLQGSPVTFSLDDQVGSGTPINIPVQIMGVNPTSGTNFTIGSVFFASSTTGTQCSGSNNNTNLNADTIDGNSHLALENDAANLADFAAKDFPGDPVDQAAEVSTELYYMSEGVLLANPFARQVTLSSQSYPVYKMGENGVKASSITEGNQQLPTARTLWNMFLDYQAPANNNTSARSLTVNDASFTSGTPQLSSVSATFQPSDIGRNVTGNPAIPAGTYITATPGMYAQGAILPANTVELSQAPTSTLSSQTVTFSGNTVGLRASSLDFLNWICSTNGDGVLSKGKDNNTGLNYDTELTNLIDNSYGFNRITDVTTGNYANKCGLIYPTWTANGTPNNNGSAINATSPYPAGVASFPLPNITSGTYNGLTGAIPFPDN